jgi:hypothetical protein
VRDAITELQHQGRCRADVEPTFAAFAGIGMASWIAYWFDPTRPESAEAVAKTMAGIFIAGLSAEPVQRSRPAKNDAAVATANRQRSLVATNGAGRQAKRRV